MTRRIFTFFGFSFANPLTADSIFNCQLRTTNNKCNRSEPKNNKLLSTVHCPLSSAHRPLLTTTLVFIHRFNRFFIIPLIFLFFLLDFFAQIHQLVPFIYFYLIAMGGNDLEFS